MAYLSLYQTNFSAGEWSPRLRRRSDLARYSNACDTALNVVVRRQGGVVKRSGSVHIAEARDQGGDNRLVPFIVSQDQSYVLDFSDGVFRAIYNQDRDYLRSAGSPIQFGIGAPWVTSAELSNFKVAQSGDVMYVVSPDFAPQQITRVAATGSGAFTRAAFDFQNGPFLPLNDDGTELSFSALTGSGITVTASANVFESGHVGAYFLVLADDLSDLGVWEPSTTYAITNRIISDGKIYEATAAGTGGTGTIQPTHTRGTRQDGDVEWTYRSSLYAVLEITAVASATSATATVVSDSDIPDSAKSGDATEFWAEGAFSNVQGWPSSVAFYQQRLWFGKGQTLYSSVLGDFDDFNPYNEDGLVDFATAITITIDDSQVDPIVWLTSMNRLVIGTVTGEKLLGEQNNLNPFGADNVKIDDAGFRGSRDFIVPVRVDDSLLVIGRPGNRVYELNEDTVRRKVSGQDRAIFADHLLLGGGFEAAYAQSPDSLYAVATGRTGNLAVMTYEPLEEIYAWVEWEFAGTNSFVESVAAMPAPDGLSDDFYLVTARLVNGELRRDVEYVPRTFDDGDDQVRWPFVDGAVIYEPGSPITTVPGLDHLEGETVQVVADGLYKGTAVVSGGQITVEGEPSVAVVGLGYLTRLVPVTPDPGTAVGASQGKRQRASTASVLLYNTINCRVGVKGGSQFDLISLRKASDPGDVQIEPRTSIEEKNPPDSAWDTETLIEVRSDEPLPWAVRGIVFDMAVENR